MGETPSNPQGAVPQRPWRNFWTQRVRARWVWALICLAGALLVGVLEIVPGDWLLTLYAWLVVVRRTASAFGLVVSSVDPHILELMGMVALAALASVILLAPSRRSGYRRNGAFAGQAPLIKARNAGRVLVYMDAENQPQLDIDTPAEVRNEREAEALRRLMTRLRDELNGRPTESPRSADMLFYMDSSQTWSGQLVYGNRRRILHSYGFRLVDVPHNPFRTGGSKKGMVDVELALQVYARSLATSQPQEIILIAADQDYIPLVYHLWADGHKVQMWAGILPNSYHKLESTLNEFRAGSIKLVEYDLEMGTKIAEQARDKDEPLVVTQANAPVSHTAPTTVAPKQSAPMPAQHPIAVANQRPKVSVAKRMDLAIRQTRPPQDALIAGIRLTQFALDEATRAGRSPIHTSQLFRTLVSQLKPFLFDRLGYQGQYVVTYWLLHVQAAGAIAAVLASPPPSSSVEVQLQPATASSGSSAEIHYMRGPVTIEVAADRLKRFLMALAATARDGAVLHDGKPQMLSAISASLQHAPIADDLHAFAALTEPPPQVQPAGTYYLTHMRHFCLCAHALGLLAIDTEELLTDRLVFSAQLSTQTGTNSQSPAQSAPSDALLFSAADTTDVGPAAATPDATPDADVH